jgi:hypothetical protein
MMPSFQQKWPMPRWEQLKLRRFSIVQLGGWRWTSVVLAGLAARLLIDMAFALAEPSYRLFGWERLPNYCYTVAFAFLILEGIRLLNRRLSRYFPWEQGFWKRFAIQSAVDAVYTLFLLNALRPALFVLFAPEKQVSMQEQVVVNVVAVGLVLIVVLIDLGLFLLVRWQVSEAELERFRKESVEFQLAMLKAQINPHFLFNSLNTLSSLIHRDTDKAGRFVQQLATVYRHVLENREREVVHLREELRFLDNYMDLLKTRFGEAIVFEWNIEPEFLNRGIAPLTLQMLVENAIKHNTRSQKKPLHIRLYTDAQGKLCVTNSMQARQHAGYSSGIGLNNIRSRYQFLTEEKIEVLQNEQQFCVKIPLLDNWGG